jgi:hypothetical protein
MIELPGFIRHECVAPLVPDLAQGAIHKFIQRASDTMSLEFEFFYLFVMLKSGILFT